MQRISLSGLVDQSTQLISLPDIVIKLNNIVNNPRSSISDFAEQIELDPVLTIRLLKIVNSPYYNFPSKVETVSTAVSVIGTQDLRDLVLTTSLVKSFKGLNNPLCSLENFWRHSVYCGVIARELANLRRDRNTESYFTAGLLHDIGSMLFYQILPEQSAEILQRATANDLTVYELEEDTFGFNSADVGSALLKSWNLPAMLEETVKFHNTPEQAEIYQLESTIIYIANQLANIIDMRSNRLQRNYEIDTKYWEMINLSPEILDTARKEIVEKFDQVTGLLINDIAA